MPLFERNLVKCGQPVVIEERNERIINGHSQEVFTNPIQQQGIIKTLRGVTVFDDTNTERIATHEICIAMPRSLAVSLSPPVAGVVNGSTLEPHGLQDGTVADILATVDPLYEVEGVTITVLSPTTFSYPLATAPTSADTGLLRYLQEYTAENWVRFKGKRVKILTVENCCEEDRVLKLMCTERGDESQVVNQA